MEQQTQTPQQGVVAENKLRQARARDLNRRAGSALFQVFSREELLTWTRNALRGARRCAEVTNWDALRLPALDRELTAKVVSDNPDAIELLGRTLPVEYRDGADPRVSLKLEDCAADGNSWRELPDQGVRLPSGRQVAVQISYSYGYELCDTTVILLLKEKVREHLNRKVWEAWSQPEIPLPDHKVEGSEVPFITAVYGRCVVTGEELSAFGTVYWDDYYSRWKPVWKVISQEAEERRATAQAVLERFRAEARERMEREAAEAAGKLAKQTAHDLYYSDESRKVESELRSRLSERASAWYLPSDSSELRQWTSETNVLIAEVKQAIAEAEQSEAEKARRAEAARRELATVLQQHFSPCTVCGKKFELDVPEDLSRGFNACSHYDLSPEKEGFVAQVLEALKSGWGTEEVSFDGRMAKVLARLLLGETVVAQSVSYYKYGGHQWAIVVYPEALGAEGEWRFERVWELPTPNELKLDEARRLRGTYAEDCARLQAAVADGSKRLLTFQKGRHPRTGAEQWESGGRGVKFVLDHRSPKVEAGRSYFCWDVRTIVEQPQFRLILVQVELQADRNLDAEIRELEVKVARERNQNSKPAEKAPEAKAAPAVQGIVPRASLDDLKKKFGRNDRW